MGHFPLFTSSSKPLTPKFLYILALSLSVAFFVLKLIFFLGFEYQEDLYVNIQSARSLYSDFKFCTNEVYGKCFHNYFLFAALGPFVLIGGAYGLFFANTLLILLASYQCLGASKEIRPKSTRYLFCCSILLILFGPISFWIFDHRGMGWNPELLYPPLALIFASKISSGKKAALLWAIPVVLIREDGPIVACAIHLLAHFNSIRLLKFFREDSKELVLSGGRIILGWIIVFTSGMLILTFYTDAEHSRISQALSIEWTTIRSKLFWMTILRELVATMALTSSILLPLLLLGNIKNLIQQLALLCLVLLPVLLACFAAGIPYFNGYAWLNFNERLEMMQYYGVLWPPRFAEIWAVVGAFVLLYLKGMRQYSQSQGAESSHPVENNRQFHSVLIITTLALIVYQGVLLNVVRNYDMGLRISKGMNGELVRQKFLEGELHLLQCSRNIFESSEALVIDVDVASFFHEVDFGFPRYNVFSDGQLDMIICDDANRHYPSSCTTKRINLCKSSNCHVEKSGQVTVTLINATEEKISQLASCNRK